MIIFKGYLEDTRGNFSLMVAVSALTLMVAIGAAVETTNMTRMKNQLQSQVDIATLAAASTTTTGQEELDYSTLAYDVMVKNRYLANNKKPEAIAADGYLDVKATVEYDGLFTEILGDRTIKLSASAQSTLPSIGAIELVLALDNTASMGYEGKIGALKIGAGKIIDAIEENNSGTIVGLVPFARYINVGDERGSWLDTPAEYDTERTWQQATHSCESYSYEPTTETRDGVEYTYDKEICNGHTTTYETRSRTIESRFEGCIGTQKEPHHLGEISSGSRVIGLLNTQPVEVTGLSRDTEAWCPLPIRPMDDNYGAIGRHINEMYPVDVTYIPMGLLWAERLLDRTVAFRQVAKDENKRQVMILMTDGKNTAEIRDDQYHQDELMAPPYIYADIAEANPSADKTDADTLTMCDRIKGKNIELFTISFKIDDDNAKSIVRDCATSENHNFDAASNDALIASFEQIGKSLSANVRLSR